MPEIRIPLTTGSDLAIQDEGSEVTDACTTLNFVGSSVTAADAGSGAVSVTISAGGGAVDTSGTPVANDFARFTDADTIEGRSYSEVRTDLGLVIGTNVQAWSAVLDATTASFTSADETKLDGIEAGADVTDEAGIEAALASTTAFTVNNYVFNVDQTVGAGQDNYVLTYDNGTGEIGLEASASGGGDSWGDPVDANIVPDADGTRALGTTLTRWAQVYTDGLQVTNNIIVNGTVDGVDISARDHDAVTITGSYDYATLSGQQITLDAINLITDVTSTLGVANGGTGATTAADARTNLDVDQAGTENTSESGIETALASTTAFTVNNYVFNVDQTVGAGQDNYVLTYDNASGEIGLEAAAGGGSSAEYADFYQSTGGITSIAGTAVTLNLSSTRQNSDGSIFSLSGNAVTVNKTATFLVTMNNYINSSGSSRTEYSLWLERDSVEETATRHAVYARGYDSGQSTSMTCILSITSGEAFRMRIQRTDGGGSNGYQDSNGTRLTFLEIP